MSKSQRAKGAAGEREVVRMIRENLGIETRRNLSQYQAGGFDIPLGRYAVEVKRRAKIGAYEFWHQAVSQARDRTPLLFMRADGEKWLVCMSADEFFRLAREDVVENE